MKCLRYSRFVAALAVSTVVLVAVVVADSPAVTPASRSDAWWQQRHESMNQRVKQGNVDLLLIGDSITQGWEGEGKDVWKKFYGNRNAVNLGIGGDQTQHVLWRLDHGNIDGISPKLAVLMIGTNNAHGGQSAADIADGIKAIVMQLRAKLPKTKVLVLGVFPCGPDDKFAPRQTNMKTNEIISKLADGETLFYLDIAPKFLAADRTLSRAIMPDLLHLNAKSYTTWAEAIEPMVAKLMAAADAAGGPAVTPAPRPDAWWQQRHESMNQRVKQGNVDLLLIGDSITQGWEGAKDVWDKFYGKRNAVNLGISGDQTAQVLWRLDHGNIDGISPKLAVIMIGTNNAGHTPHQQPEQIAEGVKAIVEKLRAKLPTTKILLLAIFPRGADNNDPIRQINVKANEIISKLDDGQKVFFLDIGPKFVAADGTLSKDVMPDLLHLNPKSYEVWAEAIEPSVAKLMGESQ
jgi:lysophospholipase L1-like esterase